MLLSARLPFGFVCIACTAGNLQQVVGKEPLRQMSMAFAALRLPERGWEVMHIWEISVSPEVQTISKNRNSDGCTMGQRKGLYEPMRQDFILRQTFQKTKTYILVGSCGWSVALLEATTHWLEESQYI